MTAEFSRLRAVVGIPCDVQQVRNYPTHGVVEQYIAALSECAGVFPVLLPARAGEEALVEVFSFCDGIFLSGAPSNVHPRHYDGAPPPPDMKLDPQRDACVLPLIRACIERGVPLFCVCRGIQELNVALGGTLHPHLHEAAASEGVAPRFDHREDKTADLEGQFAPAHDVELTPGGFLASLLAAEAPEMRFRVNSLHGQGIAAPAPGASCEAHAEDGTIEALHIPASPAFALGVQWHPEWRCSENPISRRLFAAFGDAAREHRRRRIAL